MNPGPAAFFVFLLFAVFRPRRPPRFLTALRAQGFSCFLLVVVIYIFLGARGVGVKVFSLLCFVLLDGVAGGGVYL